MANAIITAAGIAALINAEKDGTLPIRIEKFGLGTGNYTPTADRTALQSQFKELTSLSGGNVGDNTLHVSMLDDSADAYTANEVGVFLSDGTLFAVCSQPVGAILQKASGSQGLLSMDLVIDGGAGDIVVTGDTNFFNPPATRETKGVAMLATNEEAESGLNDSKIITPSSLWVAIKKAVADLAATLRGEIVPIGSIISYLGTDIPKGFLLCNGASLSREEYPELFAVIGTACGAVDEAHFNLPDLHHRFLEGTTTLSEVGQSVEAGLPNISGMLNNLVSNSATESTVTGELLRWQSRQDVGYAAKTATGGFLFDPLIDASRVNSLYGNASSLQPASVRIFALIRAY